MHALEVEEFGGLEKLQIREVPKPETGAGGVCRRAADAGDQITGRSFVQTGCGGDVAWHHRALFGARRLPPRAGEQMLYSRRSRRGRSDPGPASLMMGRQSKGKILYKVLGEG